MSATKDSKDLRWARLANVLAEAARTGRIHPQDARTALVHALRVRKTKNTLAIRPRSTGAQASIERYAPQAPPRNDSTDALHADHVYSFPHTGPKLTEFFNQLTNVEAWLQELARLDQVVCLTAAKNELVRRVETTVMRPAKYELAAVEFVDPVPW
jgi:hypothetical protein